MGAKKHADAAPGADDDGKNKNEADKKDDDKDKKEDDAKKGAAPGGELSKKASSPNAVGFQEAEIHPGGVPVGMKVKGITERRSPEAEMYAGAKQVGWDNGGDDGWQTTFTIRANRADLLQYMLQLKLVYTNALGQKEEIRGIWEDTVPALNDSIIDDAMPIYCWVLLRDNLGVQVGKLLIELDIYTENRHKMPNFGEEDDSFLTKLPQRKGAPPLSERNKSIEYYVYAYADFLPQIDRPGFLKAKEN